MSVEAKLFIGHEFGPADRDFLAAIFGQNGMQHLQHAGCRSFKLVENAEGKLSEVLQSDLGDAHQQIKNFSDL